MNIPVVAKRHENGKVLGLREATIRGMAGPDSLLVKFPDGEVQGVFPHEVSTGNDEDSIVLSLACGEGPLYEAGARLELNNMGEEVALTISVAGFKNFGFITKESTTYFWHIASGHSGGAATLLGAANAASGKIQEVGK